MSTDYWLPVFTGMTNSTCSEYIERLFQHPASVVSHSDNILSRTALAWRIFANISSALAVQTKDFGFSLCLDECFDVVERTSANSLVGDLAKLSFYQIKPGAGGRCEMHVETMVAFQPALPAKCGLVRRIIVHDEVKVQFRWRFLVDLLQKLNPFRSCGRPEGLMSVSRHASLRVGHRAGSNQPSLGQFYCGK